ncbi:DNA processing protein DprA [Neisseria arctica]|uniref:DNA processing protein DprA n=1 Tax=Neisseria arctica TaxID=1470200 RepID=A0A0J1C151_9NEIS|nr:DNA-processing protein DprA [Neisseria arctica]KLT71988.1 DNA processing protein DprA [Neisseria arctica]UOO86817.1 DNA-processing protein DprA [Neisseria arctica]
MDLMERESWVRLALTPYIGAERFLALLKRFGSASAALSAPLVQVRDILNHRLAEQAWDDAQGKAQRAAEAALKWEDQDGCRLMLLCDEDYPSILTEGITPPPLLFLRGNQDYLHCSAVAIVGSRHATPQAIRIARDFAEELSGCGVVVVSGMAAGIDTAAHQGALKRSGGTIAIWGTGMDFIYPRSNQALAYQIAEQGLIISEFPLGTRSLAGNFPRRNRIIAALAQATLVVEAAPESGSLITARLAAEMGREVMAVPGSIDNPRSKGCHKLIKEGAKLVECLDDIVQECPRLLQKQLMSSYSIYKQSYSETESAVQQPSSVSTPSPASINVEMNSKADALLDAMGYDAVHPDSLALATSLPADEIYARLLELELEGVIASMPGGRYQRIKRNH